MIASRRPDRRVMPEFCRPLSGVTRPVIAIDSHYRRTTSFAHRPEDPMTEHSTAANDLLSDAWRILSGFHPELSDFLRGSSVEELERPDGGALRMFKECGATGLIVAKSAGGIGASAEQMAHIYRAIGSRAPSLAVASSFHHMSLAALIELTAAGPAAERETVQFLLAAGALVTSGFVEDIPGGGRTLPATTRVRGEGNRLLVDGYIRPCSMARSMDLVLCPNEFHGAGLGIAVVAAGSPGLYPSRSWNSPLLRATETEELVLTGAPAAALLFGSEAAQPDIERIAQSWSSMLVVASYLGMATALMQRVLDLGVRDPGSFASAAAAVESSWSALLFACREFDAGARDTAAAVRIMYVRCALRDNLSRIAAHLIESMGAGAFGDNFEMPYLAGCLHALALHLPSRGRIASHLYEFHRSGAFDPPIPPPSADRAPGERVAH
ncbi:hypothetical protein [Nocardia sp. NPDC057668]|uniref:hypothetical protein n=1 Tax=Nocardia sp. NPDC057668 TaxID=3346202 RepID=UPI003671FEB5